MDTKNTVINDTSAPPTIQQTGEHNINVNNQPGGNVNIFNDSPTDYDESGIPYTPINHVRFDSENNIIYLGNEQVKIPIELIQPNLLTPEELPYVNALCEIYAEKLGLALGKINPDTISTALPKKLLHHYSSQRKAYYQAEFVKRMARETFSDGAKQFSTLKEDAFAGIENYINAIASKGFLQSLCYSLLITITSVIAILVCCSMCAWYITRVKGPVSKMLYFLFVFSMVVPFQMVMFTLSQTADSLKLNTPWNIWIIYLGFGAGLAVFMFAGFMKSIPLEIEEASMIDGCNPIQTFFLIVLPILKPTLVSVGILEAMWVWNDYLLPTLVLDIKKYKTIPMLIQYFRGSYGKVEMGPMMASIMLTVIPIVIVYLLGQKHIIKGVAAGAVKG